MQELKTTSSAIELLGAVYKIANVFHDDIKTITLTSCLEKVRSQELAALKEIITFILDQREKQNNE